MESSLLIRKARLTDTRALESCMQAAYGVYQARMGGARLPPMDVDYQSEIRDYPCWVVESETEIAAGLIMVFENHRASIANIAVDPKYQGQGIGGELMAFAEEQARRKGFFEIQLATHRLLDESIALYRHLGWQETGRDEARIFMKKTL